MPPVTEWSPPASRITGAVSPVIADSSTEATPSTTSPSVGITCPASTTTWSPACSVVRAPRPRLPSDASRRATVSARVRRRLSACALPRASARASAKLANRTVNHSQIAISQAKMLGSTTASAVTTTEPTQTTNMTGLRSWVRGSSLRSASGSERHSWRAENAPAPMVRPVRSACWCWRSTIDRSRVGVVMTRASAIGPRASAGKKVRAATRTTVPQTRTPNSGAVGGQRAGAGFDALLRGERAGEREHGQDRHEAAEQHRQAEGGLEERAGDGEPGEGAAVVVGRRGEGVEDLGQPVRAGVGQCGVELARLRQRSAGAEQHEGRHRQDRDRRRFTSLRPTFLPRYSGVRPTISPARNTAMTASTRIPYSPAPTPPGATSPSSMFSRVDPAAEAGVGVVQRVHRAGRGAGGRHGEQHRRRGSRSGPPCPPAPRPRPASPVRSGGSRPTTRRRAARPTARPSRRAGRGPAGRRAP